MLLGVLEQMPADRGLLSSLAAPGGLTALPSHGSHRQVPSGLSGSPSEEWAKARGEKASSVFLPTLSSSHASQRLESYQFLTLVYL